MLLINWRVSVILHNILWSLFWSCHFFIDCLSFYICWTKKCAWPKRLPWIYDASPEKFAECWFGSPYAQQHPNSCVDVNSTTTGGSCWVIFAIGGLSYFTFISFPSISVGFYCLEGSELPIACPANTIREVPGAVKREACLPCPPGRWCKTGWNSGVNSEEREWELFFKSHVYPWVWWG